MREFLQWVAPIISTIIVTAATASINAHLQRSQKVADERHAETEAKRKAEAEWRECMVKRLDSQDERINAVLQGQVTQMRSDVTHKIHRYMDDLGCASTEEKKSLSEEYKLYCLLCEKYGIENDFVANMMEQVMALPSRNGLE